MILLTFNRFQTFRPHILELLQWDSNIGPTSWEFFALIFDVVFKVELKWNLQPEPAQKCIHEHYNLNSKYKQK